MTPVHKLSGKLIFQVSVGGTVIHAHVLPPTARGPAPQIPDPYRINLSISTVFDNPEFPLTVERVGDDGSTILVAKPDAVFFHSTFDDLNEFVKHYRGKSWESSSTTSS